MANTTPPPVGDDIDHDVNQDTAVGHDDDDIAGSVDGSDEGDDDPDQQDNGQNNPEYGLVPVNKGVATRNTGLTVTKGGLQKTKGGADTGKKAGHAHSGTLPPEPKLASKGYDVSKAGIKDRLLVANYHENLVYEGMSPVTRAINLSGGLPVHPDLQRCFDKLVPYFAHVLEQVPAVPYELEHGQGIPPLWGPFVVDKVSIRDGGVVLSGYRKLKGNRQITLNTPFIDYNADNRDSWYRYADDLQRLIDELRAEVILAIEGKALNPQYSLFDEQAEAA